MEISLPFNWRPRSYQLAAWSYLERGGKHAELVWHRRAGKDELALHRTAVAAFERVGNYWYTLPKQNQARKAIWEAINPHSGKRRIDEAFPKEIRAATIDHEMLIRLQSGSTFQVVGSDNFNSLVGSPPVGVTFSEWALCDPSCRAYLRPIFLENNGWAIYNTTPRGRNHAYRTLNGAMKTPGQFGQILRADQTGIFTPEQLAEELRQYIQDYGPDFGQSMFEQEFECSFDAANLGAILGRWLSRAIKAGRMTASYDPGGAPVDISADIGLRDTASWWFWQPTYRGFSVLNYTGASGLDAEEWAERLHAIIKEKGYKLGKIYMPHDAENGAFANKRSPFEQFTASFGWDHVEVVPRDSVFNRINAARRIIEQCRFNQEDCQDGIDGLTEWAYEYNEDTKSFSQNPKHNWASHPGDAFSYGASVLEVRKRDARETPPRFPTQMTINEIMERAKQRRLELET